MNEIRNFVFDEDQRAVVAFDEIVLLRFNVEETFILSQLQYLVQVSYIEQIRFTVIRHVAFCLVFLKHVVNRVEDAYVVFEVPQNLHQTVYIVAGDVFVFDKQIVRYGSVPNFSFEMEQYVYGYEREEEHEDVLQKVITVVDLARRLALQFHHRGDDEGEEGEEQKRVEDSVIKVGADVVSYGEHEYKKQHNAGQTNE